jgi:hypothetical protein
VARLHLVELNVEKFSHRVRVAVETWDEQYLSGRINPALVADFQWKGGKHRFTLSSGRGDDITFFRDGELVVALSINYGLEYVGAQVYDIAKSDEVGDVFLDGPEKIEDCLGKTGLDLMKSTIAKRLLNRVLECIC